MAPYASLIARMAFGGRRHEGSCFRVFRADFERMRPATPDPSRDRCGTIRLNRRAHCRLPAGEADRLEPCRDCLSRVPECSGTGADPTRNAAAAATVGRSLAEKIARKVEKFGPVFGTNS